MNIVGIIPEKLTGAVFYVKLSKKTNNELRSYDKELFSSTFALCKVEKGILGNFIVKMFIEQMKDSNFTLACDIKPGAFYIKNVEPPREGLLPISIISSSKLVHWEFTALVKARPKSKAFVHICTYKIEGEVRRHG